MHKTFRLFYKLKVCLVSPCPNRLTSPVLGLHFCALLEVSLAALATLLALDPVGQLGLTSCRVDKVQDWYTFFQNPSPNYEESLHCTQEAVYPFYTMVFVFHALCVLFMLVVRTGFIFARLFS